METSYRRRKLFDDDEEEENQDGNQLLITYFPIEYVPGQSNTEYTSQQAASEVSQPSVTQTNTVTKVTFDDDEEEYNPMAASQTKQEEYSYKPQHEEEDQYKTAYESQAKPEPAASNKLRFDDDEDNTAYEYKPQQQQQSK